MFQNISLSCDPHTCRAWSGLDQAEEDVWGSPAPELHPVLGGDDSGGHHVPLHLLTLLDGVSMGLGLYVRVNGFIISVVFIMHKPSY